MLVIPQEMLKLLLAIVAGGLIGAEREVHDKAAGFRTMIFICMGATLFTIFSQRLGGIADSTRIAANIVVGVGFLGAGSIMRDRERVTGVTTASAIWLVAALGMGIGGGLFLFSIGATIVTLIVLALFPKFDDWITNNRQTRSYEVRCTFKPEKLAEYQALFDEYRLRVRRHKHVKEEGNMLMQWVASGTAKSHKMITEKIFMDPDVVDFHC